MRMWALVLIVGLGTGRLRAGAWGLDVGLLGAVGMQNFAGQNSGLKPPSDPNNLFSIYPPSVQAFNEVGLGGQAGLDLRLSRKRRWDLDLQVLWSGGLVSMRETRTFPSGTQVEQQTVWEWSGLLLPLELGWVHPLQRGEKHLLGLRLGAGAWYLAMQQRSKHLSTPGIPAKEWPWPGAPPDDWGPLLGLGLDWLELPSGRRRVSFEIRGRLGHAALDANAGAERPVWMLEGALSAPLYLWAL